MNDSTDWPADDAAGLAVFTAGDDARAALATHLATLVADKVAGRIAAQDATLWGPEAESEASIRLSWVGLADSSRPLVEPILALRAELQAEGVDRVVLCGMGGSSLAPEVIAAEAGVDLVVLDSTDPGQVAAALVELERTVIVVSSKSGSTVETDSQRRVFEKAFTDAGIDAASRIVIVTDPGSPLEAASKEAGYRKVFNADPGVGGRFSALTAFGLVPSGLAGVDIGGLLDEAASVSDLLAEDSESNPALVLGAVLGASPASDGGLHDKILITDSGSGLPGFGDWAEQLIAESTGKDHTGVLPVVVPSGRAPESGAFDVVQVSLLAPESDGLPDGDGAARAGVRGPLGAQFLLWEYAVAVAGRLLGINPFDQPDVESAKKAARGLLDATPAPEPALATDAGIEIRAHGDFLPASTSGSVTVVDAVSALLGQLGDRGFVAVMAYLDRLTNARLADVRDGLAAVTGRPVTFGWGPRFLHSTGQFHKGGPPVGVYLQITADHPDDLAIPDRPFTFGQLISAQAAGDATVLAEHDRPVLRLNLTGAGALEQLIGALGQARRA
ncbi:glucose-6-phosphate isomerase [Spongisporangium articulatum]|uniref:Glucose-6-phosphate isomerase n=1 Tax=Spongisporangium articulatum TaxID=3362603 RepID=A0ABW8ASY7_9ACTN